MFSILIPGAIISYLSMKSIKEKADNQKVKYLGTVNLVRDKLENEIIQMESDFRNSLIESLTTKEAGADLQTLLQAACLKYPAFKDLVLIGNRGELIGCQVTLGLTRARTSEHQINRDLNRAISVAEKAEFIDKDLVRANDTYRQAYTYARTSREKNLLDARIGRTCYKLNQHANGIEAYAKILETGDASLNVGEVPATIVALHQIAEGYQALGDYQAQESILFDLYRQLLDHPWDLSGGEYLFYLRSVLADIGNINEKGLSGSPGNHEGEIPFEMKRRETQIMEEAGYLQLMRGTILEEIMSDLVLRTTSEIRAQSFPSQTGPSVDMNYFLVPPAIQSAHSKALSFQFDEEYLLTELFPAALSEVDLGKDVTVGILNEKDSSLFIQADLPQAKYLVAGDFTRIFSDWKVALFDTGGKSLEQLAGREKQLYLALFIGIIAVMFVGTVFLVRTVAHETEVSRMKSEFVSNVTHELKTPLSLIRMFGETLESGIVKEEGKRQEFYSIIRKESERLTHLINNVLDFSRIDTGIREYSMETTDLVPIIRNSLEAYKFHIRDRGFEFESMMPENPVMVSVDKDAISQAFLNLLSNAVKYSKDRKYIGVEIKKEMRSVLITVMDHGIGIARGELKNIFNKFYRVPNPVVKQTRGSGLGLTLTRHIVEAHGGSIEVESEPGKGSRFTIRLPEKET